MQRNCNAVRKPSFPPCGIAPQTPTYPVPLSAGYKIVKLAGGVHSVHSLAERLAAHSGDFPSLLRDTQPATNSAKAHRQHRNKPAVGTRFIAMIFRTRFA